MFCCCRAGGGKSDVVAYGLPAAEGSELQTEDGFYPFQLAELSAAGT